MLADATQRPNPQPRGKSPRNRKRAGAFARPPVGALSLSATPAAERPNGLLGSVLRREAAIAAMKTAVQTEPPPEATHMRERKKLIRELADTMHEFREATVDAIELLAQRPEGSSRFYWNGMDLVLKMLTDMQWGPFPQTLDPLLWRWFNHWSAMWARRREATNPEPFDVRGGAPFLQRCRLAEKALLHMAMGASNEGAGMGGWAKEESSERAVTLYKVQMHRLTAAHSEGGANHAQRRRFNNMELLLYGRMDCHLDHLKNLVLLTNDSKMKAASLIQHSWRIRMAGKQFAKRAHIQLKGHLQEAPYKAPVPLKPARPPSAGPARPPSAGARRPDSAGPRRLLANNDSDSINASLGMGVNALLSEHTAGGAIYSPINECATMLEAQASSPLSPHAGGFGGRQGGGGDKLDRSFLNQMSVGLPDLE